MKIEQEFANKLAKQAMDHMNIKLSSCCTHIRPPTLTSHCFECSDQAVIGLGNLIVEHLNVYKLAILGLIKKAEWTGVGSPYNINRIKLSDEIKKL